MDNELKAKYRSKSKDSFKTKKNLFIFHLAINSKEEFSIDDFEKFEITDGLVKKYTSEYWQQFEDYQINGISIKVIEGKIKDLETMNSGLLKTCENKYVEQFNSKFSELEFIELLNIEKCHYCKITKSEIEKLGENLKLNKKSFRGWTLEIDRLNSNFEYSPKNCVMACYWCNNAKTDEFTESEFLQIGETINKIWKNRLK
ncbi:MAG: hypothetical protein R2764_14225 [Bacteroidales bacterium]